MLLNFVIKNILVEKSELDQKVESLTQQSELLQVKNQSLEERLLQLENEKTEQTEILAQIQENLIQKTSEHESQIRSMHLELDKRLDEMLLKKNMLIKLRDIILNCSMKRHLK